MFKLSVGSGSFLSMPTWLGTLAQLDWLNTKKKEQTFSAFIVSPLERGKPKPCVVRNAITQLAILRTCAATQFVTQDGHFS